MSTLPEQTEVIACDLSAFTDAQREHHLALAQKLLEAVFEIHKLPDGYALRLPDEPGILFEIADFINDDRLCCAFIRFGLEVEPGLGAIWLKLRSAAAAEAFISDEIGGLLNKGIPLMNRAVNPPEFPLMCDLSAIPADQLEPHFALGTGLYAAVAEVQELSNGYALRLPDDPGMLFTIAEYIRNERLSCTFVHFELEVEPNGGAIWLKLTGENGAKDYFVEPLRMLLKDEVASAAGLKLPASE
jgi:hypothetical protein